MKIYIERIMRQPVITAEPEESLQKAIARMEKHKVGCLPVLEKGQLVGILTSRDIRRSHPNRLVADAMTKNPITIAQNSTLWQALKLLEANNIERLPVMKEDAFVGIVTKADLLLEMGKLTDELTGLQTSGFIRFIGENLLREGYELCVLFFDLDDFGEFNKKYGHVEGDKCLKLFSQTLLSNIAEGKDYLCRYGGDEFVVVSTRIRDEAISWTNGVLSNVSEVFETNNLSIQASAGLAGGRRLTHRDCHPAAQLDELINLASLTSTKAKKDGSSLLIAG